MVKCTGMQVDLRIFEKIKQRTKEAILVQTVGIVD